MWRYTKVTRDYRISFLETRYSATHNCNIWLCGQCPERYVFRPRVDVMANPPCPKVASQDIQFSSSLIAAFVMISWAAIPFLSQPPYPRLFPFWINQPSPQRLSFLRSSLLRSTSTSRAPANTPIYSECRIVIREILIDEKSPLPLLFSRSDDAGSPVPDSWHEGRCAVTSDVDGVERETLSLVAVRTRA